MAELFIPANSLGNAALLVVEFCRRSGIQIVHKSADELKLTLEDGRSLSSLGAICQYVSNLDARRAQLLGESSEQQAQVFEWVDFAVTELATVMDDKLHKVNDWLLTRTYMLGHHLTLADLVLFGVVHHAVANFPVAQELHFVNLRRWFDLMQHTVDGKGLFPRVPMAKSKYVTPVVPQPISNKAVKAAEVSAPTGKTASSPVTGGPPQSQSKPQGNDATSSATASSAATKNGAPAVEVGEVAPEGKQKKAKKEKKEKKADNQAGGGGSGTAKGGEEEVAIDLLDIRVGQIVKVGRHPNADSLYLEEIDLGEGQPRQVISGLVKFVPVEAMQDRRVVVVCNLKPQKMRDIMSYGMVLCASNEDHSACDPIIPPEGVPLGERVTFEGYSREPLVEVNPKKKILERLFPDMTTDGEGVATFKGTPMMTSRGQVTSTLPGALVR